MSTAVEEDLSALDFPIELAEEAPEDEMCCQHPSKKATHTIRHPGCLLYICDLCVYFTTTYLNSSGSTDLMCRVCKIKHIPREAIIIKPLNK